MDRFSVPPASALWAADVERLAVRVILGRIACARAASEADVAKRKDRAPKCATRRHAMHYTPCSSDPVRSAGELLHVLSEIREMACERDRTAHRSKHTANDRKVTSPNPLDASK